MPKNRRRRLVLEHLEERRVPTAYGTPWPDAQHLTLSFAPDGTKDGSQVSALSGLLGPIDAAGGSWRRDILRAFQTWAANANVNISLAADGGADFGASGAIQGDPRFGDIRVGAVNEGSGVLALTQPFDYAAGTWAGDVNFNTAYSFGEGASNGADLFSVALHEAGHSFGLDDNTTDPTSVMYGEYSGVRTGPSAADVAALQALYGARRPDAFEGASGNGSRSSATSIQMVNLLGTNAGASNVTVGADITTPSDKDFYKFSTGLNVGPFTVQLKTSGVSSLVSRLTVYNASGKVVGSAVATDPTDGDLSVHVALPLPLSTYYVSVEGASPDAFGVGGYMLRAIPDLVSVTGLVPFVLGSVTNGLYNLDLHTNDTFSAATPLAAQSMSSSTHSQFGYKGSLGDRSDVDFYKLTSPNWSPSSPRGVMTVSVWGLDTAPVDAKAIVYDARQNPVAATLIQHEGGSYVVQVPNAQPNATYYVKISPDDPAGPTATGNYSLAIDFGPTASVTPMLGSGAMAPQADGGYSAPPSMSVTADDGGIFHFLLTAGDGASSQPAAVKMTIADAAGRVVRTLVVQAGQAQSMEVWLGPGTYTIAIQGINEGSGAAAPLTWSLLGSALSDPIKPYTYSGSGSTTTTTP